MSPRKIAENDYGSRQWLVRYLMPLKGGVIQDVKVDAQGCPVLRALREAGFKSTKWDDYAEIGRRTYHCGKILFCVHLHVAAAGEESGGRCRYVQVGVKEEPVYKLMCDPDQEASDGVEEEESREG